MAPTRWSRCLSSRFAVSRIAANTVELDADAGRKVLKLMEALEDQDDVQSVTANFNIPDEVMEEVAGAG